MTRETIKNFNKQLEYEPKIENQNRLKKFDKFIVIGMGGSSLAAGLLRIRDPFLDIIIHRDYGLPDVSNEELKNRLIILSSYSGNTEEVVSAFEEAREKNLSIAAVSVGGKLISLAEKYQIPHVRLPDTGIQPRLAVGFSLKAMLKLMGKENVLNEINQSSKSFNPSDYEKQGRALAEKLKGFAPIIYSSTRNLPLAYCWKVQFNETGKIPAFYNVLPELNHNEMTSFNFKNLSKNFYFIFLKDTDDNPKILKRMEVLEKLYRDLDLPTQVLGLEGENSFQKIFSSFILAGWTGYYTADNYGLEPEQLPMVEEFKKLIQ